MLVPKLITCLKNYNKEQFLKDLIAGIIVAIIALPLSIALAISSGVSPEKGLYTAIIGGFIVSLLGGSRVQIGGPTGAFVIIIYGIIQKYGISGLTVATIIAGVFLIIMGILKFGKVIKFIPYPITTGFTSGIAISIFSTQIKDFFGLTMSKVPAEFVPKWIAYFKSMGTINFYSLFIGISALIIIVLWPKINKKIPGTLIALIAVTVITIVFKLDVPTIGSCYKNIPATLPKVQFPTISLQMVNDLMMPGMTIAILAGIESLLSAVVADGMIGGNHRSNMELIAQGAANIFCGLFGGIPVTGAIARTAANVKNGGRTPVAGIVHSITLLGIMLVFMPYVKLIPMSSLAAVLIVVSYNMGEWAVFKRLNKAPKSDAIVFLVTFFLTVFLDLVVAIGIGMVLAALLFMRRMADIAEVKDLLEDDEDKDSAELIDAVKVPEAISFYEITGPFFFAAADKFVNVIKEMGVPSKVLIIKMSKVPVMDATAYHELEGLYSLCKKYKTKLIFLKLKPQPLNVLDGYGFIDKVGKENFCEDVDTAIERADILLYGEENSKVG